MLKDGHLEVEALKKKYGNVIGWAVTENEKSYVDGVVRNFTDGFLAEMKRGGAQGTMFTRKLLVGNVASYIGGGTATTYTALQWLLLTSAAYPQLQGRVRAETDDIMKGREPGSTIVWNDHHKMPYTKAFIWETIRCKPVNPLSIMSCAMDDVNLCGYVIPRGSIVIPSLWSLFNDTAFWKDPEVFRPERFLTTDGKSAVKPMELIAFSYGKRSCPGESVATMVLLIYFANILHHFTVEAPAGAARLSDNFLGITLGANTRELVYRPRTRCHQK
ncbi:hypothetical protein HPB52_023231 [Rhipicephalus sanguineus]|uniref:Cytochrome P450 n=1 Tax=Rhipicephalus sanguineus TaxID=34632 RepID=A0A9D4T825_RHISA|nr:hypothetical protein HPB52_023231 [Rhipicephalus sanguineus]